MVYEAPLLQRSYTYGAFPLHGTVRYGTVWLSSGRFAFPLQFSTAIEWALAETVVTVTRAVDEKSRDVRAGVLRYLIS